MKKLAIGAILLVVAVGLWQAAQVPTQPTRILEAEVLSLVDVPERPGRRVITVKFEDGHEEAIETLTPFFYKPGYTARIGVFERTLFPDVYDFVSGSAG